MQISGVAHVFGGTVCFDA